MTSSSGGSIIDLLASDGRAVPMPSANGEVRSVLLRRDARTRARTLCVEFPAGFARAATGRYQAGEEILMLAGELDLGGTRLRAGDWAWLPPGVPRRGLRAERGAVVYAWFSGAVGWEPCDERWHGPPMRVAAVAAGGGPVELRRGAVGDGPGLSAVVAAATPVLGPAELLDLSTFRWTWVEAGERAVAGPGPAHVRWHDLVPTAARRGGG